MLKENLDDNSKYLNKIFTLFLILLEMFETLALELVD